jgi:hypothetical protein
MYKTTFAEDYRFSEYWGNKTDHDDIADIFGCH